MAVFVLASLARELSFKLGDIKAPVCSIASMTSSVGITDSIPAEANSTAVIAWIAIKGFLFIQGTSTKPRTGSHVNPSIFFKQSETEKSDTKLKRNAFFS